MNPLKLLTEYRHLGITLLGALAQVIELGVIHGTALHVCQIVSAALTAVVVGGVDNVPHEPKATT